jgi:hypothetical protein
MVKDASLDERLILDRLNAGIRKVSTELWLPGSKTRYVVQTKTDVSWVGLPADFIPRDRNLRSVFSYTQNRALTIHKSFERFLDMHPTLHETGAIQDLCVNEGKLWYQPRPTAADVLIIPYHRYTRPLPSVILGITGMSVPAASATGLLVITGLSTGAVPKPGETVTATGGGTGTIVHHDPALGHLHLVSWTGTFTGTITSSSSWTATISSFTGLPLFGEILTAPSGARATVISYDQANGYIKCYPSSATAFVTSPSAEVVTSSGGWTATMATLPTINNEVPDLPEYLADPLLTNWACREISKSYALLEMAATFDNDYREAYNSLKMFCGPRGGRPQSLYDDGDYIL